MDPHAESKRLYAIEEAAVGPYWATKRWEYYEPKKCKEWSGCIAPYGPFWKPEYKYRRRPSAPPLPSLDWHGVPNWVQWALVDRNGKIVTIYKDCPALTGWRRESKPNPEWFELTRCDYKDSVVEKEAGYTNESEENKESNIMKEIPEGASRYQAVADAMRSGEDPSSFQGICQDKWIKCRSWSHVITAERVRRTPETRRLIDAEGNQWEWPEPIKKPPAFFDNYYYLDFRNGIPKCFKDNWQGCTDDINRLNAGFCFYDSYSCMTLARALLAATGQKD